MPNPEIPVPPSRAVPADAARVRGVSNDGGAHLGAVSSIPAQRDSVERDLVAADPVLEQLRSRKIQRKGLNVHVYAAVSDAFMAFIDTYDLPKGDTVSMAMQEFLERRGVTVPGVRRVTPLPQPSGEPQDSAHPEAR